MVRLGAEKSIKQTGRRQSFIWALDILTPRPMWDQSYLDFLMKIEKEFRISMKISLSLSFQFHIQPVLLGVQPCFQLRIGLQGDPAADFIPAHRTAFAMHFQLQFAHPTEADANLELSGLLDWLDSRRP